MNKPGLRQFLIAPAPLRPPSTTESAWIIPEQHPAANQGNTLVFNIAPHWVDLTTQLIRRANCGFTSHCLRSHARRRLMNSSTTYGKKTRPRFQHKAIFPTLRPFVSAAHAALPVWLCCGSDITLSSTSPSNTSNTRCHRCHNRAASLLIRCSFFSLLLFLNK